MSVSNNAGNNNPNSNVASANNSNNNKDKDGGASSSDNGGGGVGIEEKMRSFLSDLVKMEHLELSFNQFLVHRPDLEAANREQLIAEFTGPGVLGSVSNPGSPAANKQIEQALK